MSAESNEKVNPHFFDIRELVRRNDSIILPPEWGKWSKPTASAATYVWSFDIPIKYLERYSQEIEEDIHDHPHTRDYRPFIVAQFHETELAHLYFLPKAHKPNTPLRPIMAGLKSPAIKISRWLDSLLRTLFDRLALDITIINGVQLIKQVERWSVTNLTSATLFITMDVTDLYTMIPQEEGVTAIKRLMETSNLKQINVVTKDIILALTRFVMTNNYFYLDGFYYKQIRRGAMGSPLTLTTANTYMYFAERPISKWAHRTCSLYYRYIDDLFIMSNMHAEYGTIVTDDGETPVINDTISCIDFHVNYCVPYPVLYLF
ncbi:unnamed protein product [Adineta steineri]|uniref:Reverse transcriptase domain-containing protein n=1 Tax=Adineta steineri TaxID=433720 RepID=A0A814IRR3_9BILA|nr:unnamed protein product [Adineta steineri]CAF1063301.1 unnamed protein product [Adineta steineri]